MLFVNATPYPAALPRSALDDSRSCGSLVARVTYDLEDGGRLVPSAEQPWTVSPAPFDSPRGPREADGPFLKGGVDLYLFGYARAPYKRPARSVDVSFSVGTFTRRAIVHGNRHWRRQSKGIYEASPASEFLEMALTRTHAYGGTVRWDGLSVPWAQNPAGKGFWLDEDRVEGVPLPNLEEPDRPMRAWLDRPPVCGFGFCPLENAERFLAGVVTDAKKSELHEIKPRLFNTAFPPMVAPRAEPGDSVAIGGVLHQDKVRFNVPPPPFELLLRFGAKKVRRLPQVDEIGVEVDEKRVFVTYRFGFRYTVRAQERREATLVLREVA
jgi:hypothetical protein